MKRKAGLIFIMSLLALSPGMSHADPAYEHSKDDDQYFASLAGGVVGGVGTLGALGEVRIQRDTVNILEKAYKHDWVPYGQSRAPYHFIPGAGKPGEIAYETLIVKDEKIVNLRKEIQDLDTKYWQMRSMGGLAHDSPLYKKALRNRDKAEELTKAMNLRSDTIWDYYKNGDKYYKGNMLTADEINKINALRANERLVWRQVMREEIRKEKKKMILPAITSIVGLLGTSYAVMKGSEVTQRMKKAQAEARGGSNESAQPQAAGAAAR